MSTRVFEHRQIWTVTEPALAEACRLLAAAARRIHAIDAVIGIRRGGTRPARLIAGHLDVPLFTASARHNACDAPYQQGTGNVTAHLDEPTPPRNRGILVVDDIAGSGATLSAVRDVVDSLAAPTATITATLCRNEGSPPPDLWIWNVRDWVAFPWEAAPPAHHDVTPLPYPESVRFR